MWIYSDKISAISAISVSPNERRIALLIRFHPNKNIKGPEVVDFLEHMVRQIKGSIFLLWDRNKIHIKTDVVQEFLESHQRIHANAFPAAAPELNPDEYVWYHLKGDLANSIPENLKHLEKLLQSN
jgi:hypothetical protein